MCAGRAMRAACSVREYAKAEKSFTEALKIINAGTEPRSNKVSERTCSCKKRHACALCSSSLCAPQSFIFKTHITSLIARRDRVFLHVDIIVVCAVRVRRVVC